MTKKLLTLCFMMLTVVSMHAQSLVGKWQSKENAVEENSDKSTILLDITDNSHLTWTLYKEVVEKEDMIMKYHVTLNGTYSQQGKKLAFNLDRNNSTLTTDEITFLGEAAKMAEKSPETESFVRSLMEGQLKKSKGDIVRNIPAAVNFVIKKSSKNSLVLIDETDNTEMNFERLTD